MGRNEEAQGIIAGGNRSSFLGGIRVLEGMFGGLENLPWSWRHWGHSIGTSQGADMLESPYLNSREMVLEEWER